MDAAESTARQDQSSSSAPSGPPVSSASSDSAKSPVAPADALSAREQEVLAFERQWWKYAGAKEQAIREIFAMSSTRYYQILNQLIDKQEAMRADPMLVKRLRKMRASRQRTRAARRLGIELS
ncbi:Protein of unknown function [Amycolatopsis marina]|uniref:DUF3263 domain-containing protein n=1 Tax=Amycolatopsis marina TaxID=490629 RepID=A0A1I1CCX1_9PSEU|nr:DUF3263 domain-containing protein [Amycolatopsis marina]SFB60257.1 Protein of unknown function [Amycolatopsis marina]